MHPSVNRADSRLLVPFINYDTDYEDLRDARIECQGKPETQERFCRRLFNATFRDATTPERTLNDVLDAPDIEDRERALGMMGMMKTMYGQHFDYELFENTFNDAIVNTIF